MQLLTDSDIDRIKQRYTNSAFAGVIAKLKATAQREMNHPLDIPDEGAGWIHDYTCPDHATRLSYNRDKPQEHVCDVDGAMFTGGVYDEAWRAFRNNELIRSAYAAALLWLMNGEQPYLDHAATILTQYAQGYDNYPVHGTHAGQGRVMGQSLTEAAWSIPTAWTFDIIRDALSEEQETLIQNELLIGLGKHLLTQLWTVIHNIECWHQAGLATLGVVLGEEKYIQPIFRDDYGFEYQINKGVLEDGWWWEGSPHYHFYTTQAMTSLAMAVRYQHPELLELPRFKRMFEAPLDMLRADLSVPAMNDGWFDTSLSGGIAQYANVLERVHGFWGSQHHAEVLARIYMDYRERDLEDALIFGPETLPDPTPAEPASFVHKYSGYTVLKSVDCDLLLKYGPHGGGHGHPDKLALVLWGHGQRLSPDLGTPGYGIAMNRSWYRHTLSHNTVLLDEEPQEQATGRLLKFVPSGDGFDVVDANVAWDEGEDEPYKNVQMRRVILWKEAYFIDLVGVTCPKKRLIDLAWHHTGTLEMGGLVPSRIMLGKTGYTHLSNIHESYDATWNAVWRTVGGSGSAMWAFNPLHTHTLVTDAPSNPASETLSLILRRVEAESVMFLSVIAPFAENPVVKGVQWMPRKTGYSVRVDGERIADLWHICLTDDDRGVEIDGYDVHQYTPAQ